MQHTYIMFSLLLLGVLCTFLTSDGSESAPTYEIVLNYEKTGFYENPIWVSQTTKTDSTQIVKRLITESDLDPLFKDKVATINLSFLSGKKQETIDFQVFAHPLLNMYFALMVDPIRIGQIFIENDSTLPTLKHIHLLAFPGGIFKPELYFNMGELKFLKTSKI